MCSKREKKDIPFNEVKAMESAEEKRFESALYAISAEAVRPLMLLEGSVKSQIQEIRLRLGKPLTVTTEGRVFYVTEEGKLTSTNSCECFKVRSEHIKETFKQLIRGSVYSHLNEIKEGYIMMRYGHRAGICGTFTKSGNMSNISSVNIRVSRQIFGAADEIVSHYSGGGVLIAGPPASGKTTVLRDFIRQMSSGKIFSPKRICVIDTRGEISASFLGESFNDLGENTDVLIGYEKAKGFEMAIRTMSPDIVAFDEFATNEELESVSQGFMSGVNVALTAHINSENDLIRRSVTKNLLLSGVIDTVAILQGYPFEKISVKKTNQVLCKCG